MAELYRWIDRLGVTWECDDPRHGTLCSLCRRVADPLDLDAIEARPSEHWVRSTGYGAWVGPVVLPDERDALVAVARWAQDAPHHYGCRGGEALVSASGPCTCGRDEALNQFMDANKKGTK